MLPAKRWRKFQLRSQSNICPQVFHNFCFIDNYSYFIFRYVHEVAEAIYNHLTADFIQFPTTRAAMNEMKMQFMNKFNFPGVIGAIDGSHIAILKPREEEYNFINRKGFHSLNVQLICDADLKIISVNANYPGSTHDAFIWRNSMAKNFLANQYSLGLRRTWLIGDAGYPLQPYLMTPYLNPNENSPESRYNQSHSRARNCIERCIGLLKMRFRCLLKERVARYSPNFVGKLVNACAVLHNLCINFNANLNFENENFDDDIINNIPNNMELSPQEAEIIRNNIVNTYFA